MLHAALERVVVADRAAALQAAGGADGAGLHQQGLGQAGLAGAPRGRPGPACGWPAPTARVTPRRVLPVVVVAQLLGTSPWFAVNAVMPDLRAAYGWPDSAVGTLSSALQLGFIVGTLVFALLAIADRLSARRVFLGCALAASACTLAAAASAEVYGAGGLAHGDRLLHRGHLPGGHEDRRAVVPARAGCRAGLAGRRAGARQRERPCLAGPGGGGCGAELASRLRRGGDAQRHGRPRDDAARARADPPITPGRRARPAVRCALKHLARCACACLGLRLLRPHVGALHAVGADAGRAGHAPGQQHIGVVVGLRHVLGAGAIGCIGGGLLVRRHGSARVAGVQLAISGLCCLAAPWLLQAPLPVFLAWLLLWGITVAGDSPQFSALTAYWNATSAKLRSLRLCSGPGVPARSSSTARMPMRRCWSTRSR
jgi:MFS transporter, DHA1 family, inner membrane transport protein